MRALMMLVALGAGACEYRVSALPEWESQEFDAPGCYAIRCDRADGTSIWLSDEGPERVVCSEASPFRVALPVESGTGTCTGRKL